MASRRKRTGYKAGTLGRRLIELAREAQAMGEDGRLPKGTAVDVEVCLRMAIRHIESDGLWRAVWPT